MRVLWLFALAAIVPAVFLSTRSGDALNPDIQNQFDLAIDTDVAGNSASALGNLDPCVAVTNGQTFSVDLIVRGVPAPGIAALAADIRYDPAVLKIVGKDVGSYMLGVGGLALGFSDIPPDTDGDFRIDDANLSLNFATGDGVIQRLTFQALSNGSSTLIWDDDNSFGSPPYGQDWDGVPDVYYVDMSDPDNPDYIGIFPNMRARGAEVVVGGPCPGDLLDADGDGFGDLREDHVDTLVLKDCAATAVANDETFDSWPPDFDNNQTVNISDVLALKPVFNQPSPPDRFDLVPSGTIVISDVLALKPVFSETCTP